MSDRCETTEAKGGRRGLLGRFVRGRKGTAALEFVLLGPVYFLMFFAIIELALISFAATTLKAGVAEASRMVRVGKAQCFKDEEAREAICGGAFLNQCANRLTVDRETFGLDFGGGAKATSFSAINPGDVIVLSATYDYAIITPIMQPLLGDDNGDLPLTRSLVFKTEAFTASSCP